MYSARPPVVSSPPPCSPPSSVPPSPEQLTRTIESDADTTIQEHTEAPESPNARQSVTPVSSPVYVPPSSPLHYSVLGTPFHLSVDLKSGETQVTTIQQSNGQRKFQDYYQCNSVFSPSHNMLLSLLASDSSSSVSPLPCMDDGYRIKFLADMAGITEENAVLPCMMCCITTSPNSHYYFGFVPPTSVPLAVFAHSFRQQVLRA